MRNLHLSNPIVEQGEEVRNLSTDMKKALRSNLIVLQQTLSGCNLMIRGLNSNATRASDTVEAKDQETTEKLEEDFIHHSLSENSYGENSRQDHKENERVNHVVCTRNPCLNLKHLYRDTV